MDKTEVVFRNMREEEAKSVAALIAYVFSKYVLPTFSKEGIEEFFEYANTDDLIRRSKSDHFILVAETGSHLIGMIEVRDFNHVSLLFVDPDYQRIGIGSELVRLASDACLEEDPKVNQLTVHSSPNAVRAYQAMGFELSGDEQEVRGIRFVPMTLHLPISNGA